MNDEELIQAIAYDLRELDIAFDNEQFQKNLGFLSKLCDLSELKDKISTLKNIITSTKDDFDAKRDAYELLIRIHELETLIYLTDDISRFESILKAKDSKYNRISACLKAALVGATNIAESLASDCNPKENTYLISYAICSGKSNWVKQLVERYNIDISLKEYCFLIYSQRLHDEKLIAYYQSYIQLKKSTSKAYATTSQGKFFLKERADIPPVLLGIFEDGILGLWETLQEFSVTDQKLILSMLRDTKLTPEQASYLVRQIEQDNGLPEILSSSFDILFCAFHPRKWESMVNNQHKKTFIDNTASIALSSKASIEAKERAISKLKIHAHKYVHGLLNQLSIEDLSLTEAESSRKAQLWNSLNNQKDEESNASNSPRMHNKSFIDDYLDEFQPYYDNLIKQNLALVESNRANIAIDIKLDSNAWKNLNKTTLVWKDIYNLVKHPPLNKRERNEDKMLGIIKSILYKEATQCRWGDLPKWAPPVGQVYYYYREWLRMNLLKKIIAISNDNSISPSAVK